jgi:hypothetical protein
MFGLGQKKRNREFAEDFIRVATVRINISRALETVALKIPANQGSHNDFCVSSVSALVDLIAHLTDDPIEDMVFDDDIFVAGIFAFAIGDYLTRIVGASFETVIQDVVVKLFGEDMADQVDVLAASYNAMIQEGQVILAIGQTLSAWMKDPTRDRFARLMSLYDLCKEYE